MNVVSLFSGAGGADLGFEQAGHKVIFALDIDPYCKETYDRNFTTVLRPWSIRDLDSRKLPDCDIIIGGPPCQSFSRAKQVDKFNCSGLVNVLDMQRIVRDKQPLAFVCENVPALLNSPMQYVFSFFQKGFENAGYRVRAYVLNAEDYGIPQSRERLFFIGYRNDLDLVPNSPLQTFGNYWGKEYSGWADYLDIKKYAVLVRRASAMKGRLPTQAAWTVTGSERMCIRTSYGSVISGDQLLKMTHLAKGIEQRYLEIEEIAKLQGFPSDFLFIGNTNKIRMQIGNAWCVPVGKAIGQQITKDLRN